MINDIEKLKQLLQLPDMGGYKEEMFRDFPLQVPPNFVKRIKPKDIRDPLLLQILPQPCEQQDVQGFVLDPIAEQKYSPLPGVIHKYPDRILLLVTDACALNCRFCFRKALRTKICAWHQVFNYIDEHAAISEVILSGGDPLLLDNEELVEIIQQLAAIFHIKRLRIHSRIPIIMPELVSFNLTQTRLPIVLVIHCNHPNEINTEVAQVLEELRCSGITVLNQSVLLQGINDDPEVLLALSEKLFSVGVLPYYLHVMDKVKGAAHFYVNINRARELYFELQAQLAGYLVPKLVVEIENRKYILGTYDY